MFRKKRLLRLHKNRFAKSTRVSKPMPLKIPSKKLFGKGRPLFTKIRKLFTLLTVLGGTILLLYLSLFSGYFAVKEIRIGNKNFENQALSDKIENNLKSTLGKNLIFLEIDKINTKILELFPEIESVKVLKKYPGTVEIEFLEYPLAANVISEAKGIKKSYIINTIGYTVKEDLESTGLPYIRIKSDEPINLKTPVIEAQKLKYIIDTVKYFEDKFGMRVVEVEYKKIAREIHILTEKHFYIWIDIQKSAEEQFRKLKKSLVKLDIYTEPLQYIDLRIAGASGDKIIYKRR